MASKLGFILSAIFAVQLFVLFGDLVSIQTIYTNLDAVSVTAGCMISASGGITDDVRILVENETGGAIEPLTKYVIFGSPFEYKLSREYQPYIMGHEPMVISIVRSVVIGYYDK